MNIMQIKIIIIDYKLDKIKVIINYKLKYIIKIYN